MRVVILSLFDSMTLTSSERIVVIIFKPSKLHSVVLYPFIMSALIVKFYLTLIFGGFTDLSFHAEFMTVAFAKDDLLPEFINFTVSSPILVIALNTLLENQ